MKFAEDIGGDVETKTLYVALSMMAEFKYCKYCGEDVSPMSKCTAKGRRSFYHADLVYE